MSGMDLIIVLIMVLLLILIMIVILIMDMVIPTLITIEKDHISSP